MLQVKLEPAVIHTIKTEAFHADIAPGVIVERAIREKHPVTYRSMLKRLKEGA